MCKVCLAFGQTVEIHLDERRILLGNKLWVREVCKLIQGGH